MALPASGITSQYTKPTNRVDSSTVSTERLVLTPTMFALNHQGKLFQLSASLSITVISSVSVEISTSNTEARLLRVSRLALLPFSTRWMVLTFRPQSSASCSCDQPYLLLNFLTIMHRPRQSVSEFW